MAIRALITGTDAQIQGDNLRLTWLHIFYGSPLPAPDAGPGELIVTPGMTTNQIKTGIKAVIQDDATRLGYGMLARAPQHVDEVFHNL